MNINLQTCSTDVKSFIYSIQKEITAIVNNDLLGFYIHGSIAMGGFNPDRSDIDVLAVTKKPIAVKTKRELAKFFLKCSNSPYPVEISFINKEQFKDWQHPCPFDFHFSEFWRDRYENELLRGTYDFINGDSPTDPDLAAHITIIKHRGICVAGKPIAKVFPIVPRSDYISSIVGDFQDCLNCMEEDPIYCTLSMLRVFWYLKEGIISSKEEAGRWGLTTLPKELKSTVNKVMECYTSKKDDHEFENDELFMFRKYVSNNVQKLLS